MKSFISIILSLVLTSVYAIDRRPPNVPFDPVVSQFGFQTTDGVFSGNGSDLFNVNPKSGSEMTNMSFFTSSGIVIGGLDGNGTFTLSDTNYLFAVSFDPTVPQFFITDTNLTEKFKVLGSLLYLDNPIIVGSLTGNGSGLSNAVDLIAGSNITVTTNANKRSYTIASTGGSGTGIATNGGSGINNLFTNASMKNIFLYDITGSVYNQFTTYNTAVFSLGVLAVTNGQLSYFGGSGLLSVKMDTTNVLASAGSSLNQVGITNGSLTVPGNIDVAGTFTVGTTTSTQLLSTATGNTNRMPVWGPNGNLTNVSLVNLTFDTGVFPATLTANTGDGFELRMSSNNVASRVKHWRIYNAVSTSPATEGLSTWSIVGGTGLNVPGTSTRMNNTLTYSGAATNSDVFVTVNTGASCATNFYYWSRIALTNITQIRVQFGWNGSRTVDDFSSFDTALFRYSTAAGDTTWKCITANGSSSTTNNSGVAVTADTAYDLAMYRNGASIIFYINGSSVATNTTTLPDDYGNVTLTFGGRTLDASTYGFRFFGAEGWFWQY